MNLTSKNELERNFEIMKKIIETLKKPFAVHVINKSLKECKHEYEISDVLDLKKDPKCYKCSKTLSELSEV